MLADDPALERVAAVAPDADLKASFEGFDRVVYLPWTPLVPEPEPSLSVDLDQTRRVLDAAGVCGVGGLVVLSSAVVYGAWPNNPVPLTEVAPLRPNPGFGFAVRLAEVERLVEEWRIDHADAAAAVLRPALVVDPDHEGWMGLALDEAATGVALEESPSTQHLHVDDLAAAVAVVARAGLDGAYNVAPEGALAPAELRELSGFGPRVAVPERVRARLVTAGWRLGLSTAPPGLLPYVQHPWVVAADRLRGEGWTPSFANDEAYVAAHHPGPWSMLSPRRRQEIALGAAGVGVASVLALAGALAVRALRRRG